MITPILHKPQIDADAAAEDNAEARTRQALGKLGTAKPGNSKPPRRTSYQAKPGAGRHRFRQDGEVPVLRISLAEGGRGGEHQPRAPAEVVWAGAGQEHRADVREQDSGDSARQVQELTQQLQATRTRLGHAELALAEANRSLQAGQEEAAGLREALAGSQATLAQLQGELAARKLACATTGQQRQKTKRREMDAVESGAALVRRKVGRPLGLTNRIRRQDQADGLEAVKWWTTD